MLSDFDLAKQSNEPGGMPVMIQSETGGVSRARPRRSCR
jgi:protein-serine/threonine kinase